MDFTQHHAHLSGYLSNKRIRKPEKSESVRRPQTLSAPIRSGSSRLQQKSTSSHSEHHYEHQKPEACIGDSCSSLQSLALSSESVSLNNRETSDMETVNHHYPENETRARRLAPLPSHSRSSTLSQIELSSSLASGKASIRKVPTVRKQPYHAIKPSMSNLPEELVLRIFSYFTPGDLLSSSRVSRQWLRLTNDNLLWRHIFQRYVSDEKADIKMKGNDGYPPMYWKNRCLSRPDGFKPKNILRQLKKLHRFTGLPAETQQVIDKLALKWVLSFVAADGKEEAIAYHSDCCHFSMATCVRWYNADLSIGNAKKLRFYAARPVFSDSKGKPLANSPCRRTLLLERDFSLHSLVSSDKPLAGDKLVSLYDEGDGLLIATWKETKDLAFVALSLHADQLVQRCILGSHDMPYALPEHKVQRDDVDPEYGLHGYSCTLELRNLRNTLWTQQFSNLFCRKSALVDHSAVFQLISPDRSFERSSLGKKIGMPWKTTAFTGKVPNVCILDCTVFDEHKNVMWSDSLVACVRKDINSNVRYEYEGDDLEQLLFMDSSGHRTITAILIWEESTQQYFMTSLQLSFHVSVINDWFGTTLL